MAKKVIKKTATKKVTSKKTVDLPIITPVATPKEMTVPRLSPKVLTFALVVLGIALFTYKVGPYFVPALIGYTPVSRFEIWSRLEKTYGTQALDDLVNEKILDSAISKSGVKIDQAKVDAQIKDLEAQFETVGGLDSALSERGMTRDELIKQIKTQLSVEEILKDKVMPSDDDIMQAYTEGSATTFKDQKLEEVKDQIKDQLTQTKLVEAFRDWFEMVKAEAKLKSFGL